MGAFESTVPATELFPAPFVSPTPPSKHAGSGSRVLFASDEIRVLRVTPSTGETIVLFKCDANIGRLVAKERKTTWRDPRAAWHPGRPVQPR